MKLTYSLPHVHAEPARGHAGSLGNTVEQYKIRKNNKIINPHQYA